MKQTNRFMLAVSLLVLTCAALAETYTVEVQLNSSVGEQPLVVTQTQALVFPELNVTDATKEGATCYVFGDSSQYTNAVGFDGEAASQANSLCPNLSGELALIQFLGAKSATISINFVLPVQIQSGVRFSALGEERNVTVTQLLSSDIGEFSTSIGASIDLVDKSQVTDALLVFNYEITGAYQ